MSKFSIVFIHGYTASSQADWYPAISPLLQKEHVDFIVPDLPGGEFPHASEWLDTLHKAIENIHKPIVLVGHSLGSRTALLYLEKYHPRVERVFLIAAFANSTENAKRNYGKAYPDFFTHVINIENIKPLAGKFIVIHSKDDSSIPYSQGVSIAEDLGAELITFEDRDHFSDPDDASIIFDVLWREMSI